MPLNEIQRRTLKDWMRSKAILQCPACGDTGWRFAEAAYLRALLEAGDADPTEGGGSGEGLVRQLRVRGALRRRDGGDSGHVGLTERYIERPLSRNGQQRIRRRLRDPVSENNRAC
jgi:hypothetical protein